MTPSWLVSFPKQAKKIADKVIYREEIPECGHLPRIWEQKPALQKGYIVPSI
jgi:hypothetical protein